MNYMMANTEYLITLQQLKGVGNKTIFKVLGNKLAEIKSLQELFYMCKTNKGKSFVKLTYTDFEVANQKAKSIIAENNANGIGIITFYDINYPSKLRNCITEEGKVDPPLVLYYRGNLDALKMPSIAIIGTRRPTENGSNAAYFFSKEFASRGYNIVSGLAIGCDTKAHEGTMSSNGTTTAVLANGLDWDSIFPKENIELAKSILDAGGLLLSEYPVSTKCNKYYLVARDRLQAGLSKATIGIQSSINGGTMHAIKATLKANKPLFMVKYKHSDDLLDENVQGNEKYINEGLAYSLCSTSVEKAHSVIIGME